MRFYIGFDIGDAESIIEMTTSAGNVQPATMPGESASGQAIPTMYALDDSGRGVFAKQVALDYESLRQVEMNFKRCPGDLISLSPERENELLGIAEEKLLDEPEFASGPIREYAERLCTFVNIVMTEERFMERARAFAVGCEDCEIYVGRPTNWNRLDCHIYRAILLQSVLGKGEYLGLPTSLHLVAESRAAFLYIRNTYSVRLSDGEFVGLMDVGSSTIDISVLTKSSKNCIYDSGSNFLGARSIDYLILEYYAESIRQKTPQEFAMLEDVLNHNEAAFHSLLINCRFAKETIFSSVSPNKDSVKSRIFFGDFAPVTLTWKTLVEDICARRPIAPVLEKYCALPRAAALTLGDRSWISAFRAFLQDQIDEMRSQRGIELTKLFLTGSASRMEFIRDICREMIPELTKSNSLFDDTNPSNAIAEGLARTGLSDYVSDEFKKDMDAFFDLENGDMYVTIRRRIPDLISDLADPIITTVQEDIIFPALRRWKSGSFKTLQEMMNDIKRQCEDKENFNKILANNSAFQEAVNSWMVNKIGHDIAVSLQGIAQKHRVYDFSIDQLNAFKTLKLNVGGDVVRKEDIKIITRVPADQIAGVVAAVAGIVSYFVVPFITGFVLGIMYMFFEALALQILTFLIANPAVVVLGFAAIAIFIGLSVYSGYEDNKEEINRWLLQANLPSIVRNNVDIGEIAAEMKEKRTEMVKKLSDELNTPEAVNKIGEGIFNSIYSQVEERSNQIRYEIESR